ncbi:MAG: hypothetical protein A2W31_06780 [Planctomycetes bacterium RBG_16_64_10]|nr:MAG: hypothetical protein A2W31_06780 [Planctomycetes bacterium RBG_16_64_10]
MSDWWFVAGIDPAQGGAARTELRAGDASDDFAMATWRAKPDGPAELVNIIRATGMSAKQMSAVIHQQNRAFNYDLLVMDMGGGGLSLRDELREPVQVERDEPFKVLPLITKDDEQLAGAGNDRLVLFSRSDSRISGNDRREGCPGMGMKLESESLLPNKMHELFRGALEQQPPRVRFPKPYPKAGQWDGAENLRAHLNRVDPAAGRDRVALEVELALMQLIQVSRVMATDGMTPNTDKYGFYKFESTEKKDAAYAMIYGYFGVWMLRMEHKLNEGFDDGEPTSPIFGTEDF